MCLGLMIAREVQERAVNSGASPVDARDLGNLPKPTEVQRNAISDRRNPAGASVAVRRIVEAGNATGSSSGAALMYTYD